MLQHKSLAAVLLSLLVPGSSAFPTRLNLGATESWTDNDGNIWEPDSFGGTIIGGSCPGPFSWTQDANLVCSRKEWQTTSGDLEIAVPSPGLYEAVLYFSEVDGAIADRVMNVLVEGSEVYSGLDVVKDTGFPTSYFFLTIRSRIRDGSFTIKLTASQGNPALAAIQVTADGATPSPIVLPPPTALPAPTPHLPNIWRVNVGSPSPYTGAGGKVWAADAISSGSAVDQCSTFSFFGLDNPNLYCKYRQWSEQGSSGLLEFPVEEGFYSVKLYFSETSAAAGERVVDIFFEGSSIVSGLDVASLIGGSYGVYTYTISSRVADGAVSLELRASIGSPVLAAIEIFDPNAPPVVPTPAPTTPPTGTPTTPPTITPTTSPTLAICRPYIFADEGFSASVAPTCTGNMLDAAREIPELSMSVQQIELAGLTEMFNCPGPFTTLFPTNSAFESLPPGHLDALLLPENVAHLRLSILYHTLPGAIFADDFQQGILRPLSGGNTTIDTTISPVVFNDDNRVVSPDIVACNGVIHVLGGLLNEELRRMF